MNRDTYPRANRQVIGRNVEDEAVLVLPRAGQVKVLNEVGALIWQLCDGEHSIAQIVAAVCQEYDIEPEQAEADTLRFLEALAQREMING